MRARKKKPERYPQAGFGKRYTVFRKHFIRDWQLYLLIMIPTVKFVILKYFPIYGLQIAFRNYRMVDGISGSEWVGLENFRKFLTDPDFLEVFGNTLIISLYSLLTFPLPIILALLLNAMRRKRYQKFVQTVAYMPHFISTAVFVGIISVVFSPVNGLYGNLYRLFGGTGYPVDFKGMAGSFRHLYVWSGVWQTIGWSSILYTSALAAVPPELHEAAMIDGASRFKRVIHVDLPSIMPTIGVRLIMRIGSFVGVGFEKAYMLQTPLNLSTSEVLSTLVYKEGLNRLSNFSFGSAVGLFDNVINVILMLIANWSSKKLSNDEISLL